MIDNDPTCPLLDEERSEYQSTNQREAGSTILYSAVCCLRRIVAKSATCPGNFTHVVSGLLQIYPQSTKTDRRLTVTHGNYSIHSLNSKNFIFLCITMKNISLKNLKAYLFLKEVQEKFFNEYGTDPDASLEFVIQSEFSRILSLTVNQYTKDDLNISCTNIGNSSVPSTDKLLDKIEEVKAIMTLNINELLARGQHLADFTSPVDEFNTNVEPPPVVVKRRTWWSNAKLYLIYLAIIILAIYFIVSAACGGFRWKKCRK
ncbi:hypothetical protein SNEBB_002203 [Seison nebaliae]|nr:hypothetical protein SNEBB_002203 [Seison nebaliae]